jgi:molybdopterin/thiamine biosynthesis adenylyltransferase
VSDGLSPEEARRYARHLVLKDLGGAGQQKLKAAKVLVIGAGGLGSPVIAYLASAGVGTLGICDDDVVALSNLQRQIVHATGDIGTPKTESAQTWVERHNPHVTVHAHRIRLDASNATALVAGYDVVIDGTDDFATRQATAAAAKAAGKPLVMGAVSTFDGQLTVFLPGEGQPGFDDLFSATPSPEDMPSCEVVGVLGAVTGVIGTLMAMEAIKLVTGVGEPLAGRLLLYDGRSARFTEIAFG